MANLTLLVGQSDPSRPSPQPRGVGREQPATSLPGIQAPTPTALELLVANGTQLRRFAARLIRPRLTTLWPSPHPLHGRASTAASAPVGAQNLIRHLRSS